MKRCLKYSFILEALFCGVLLFISFQKPIFSFCSIISFVWIFCVIENRLKKTEVLPIVIMFCISFILLQYSFLIIPDTRSSYEAIVLLIPISIYILPMFFLCIKRKYIVELFALLFLLSEYIFMKLEIGNPFLQIGNIAGAWVSWFSVPYFAGAFWSSFTILFASYAVFLVIRRKRKPYCLILVICLLLVCKVLIPKFNSYEYVKAGIISAKEVSSEIYIDSMLWSKINPDIQFIIMPEAIGRFRENELHYAPFITKSHRFLNNRMPQTTILMGLWLYNNDSTMSNLVAVLSKESFDVRYKQVFIPFTEYIPYYETLGNINFLNKVMRTPLKLIYNNNEVFEKNKIKFLPLICYESLFVDKFSKAIYNDSRIVFISASNYNINSRILENIILNILTINAFSNNISIIRATENGISCVIAPNGKRLYESSYKDAYDILKVPLNYKKSYYANNFSIINNTYFIFIVSLILLISFISPYSYSTIILYFQRPK